MARRKKDDEYKFMARTLRAGFIDPEETAEFPHTVPKGTSKSEAARLLRRKGYAVGKELVLEETARATRVTDVRRSGRIASGFTAADGYDLRDVENWTPQQKQKLTRIYNKVKQLTERPYHVYRARKRENLERVQEATSPHGYPKEVDIAFVPVARPGEKPEIKFTTHDVVIEDEPQTIETVTIGEREVDTTPIYWADVGVTEEMIRESPKKAVEIMHAAIGAREYSPMAGAHQQPESYTPAGLTRELRDLVYGYPERWPKFLLGVQAYSYPRQSDLASYRRSREGAKEVQRDVREKDKKRFRETHKGRKQKR